MTEKVTKKSKGLKDCQLFEKPLTTQQSVTKKKSFENCKNWAVNMNSLALVFCSVQRQEAEKSLLHSHTHIKKKKPTVNMNQLHVTGTSKQTADNVNWCDVSFCCCQKVSPTICQISVQTWKIDFNKIFQIYSFIHSFHFIHSSIAFCFFLTLSLYNQH